MMVELRNRKTRTSWFELRAQLRHECLKRVKNVLQKAAITQQQP